METEDVVFTDLDSELAHMTHSIEIFPEASVKSEFVNSFLTIFVAFRKSLCLKVVLQTDYPKVWPISVKLLAYEITANIKPARQTLLVEFLTQQEAIFNSLIDSSYGKCCIHKMVDATISALADDMQLSESLDALESQSKNKTLVENELSRSSIGSHVVYEAASNPSSAESSPKPAAKSSSVLKPIENKKQKGAKAQPKEEETQKAKFRGSDYIFDRIKWDESIDTDQVIIGYLDRFLGVKEIKFNDFKHVHDDYREGIPMHRIRHFRINDLIVWDRDKKLDILTGETDISKFFKNPAAKAVAADSTKNADKQRQAESMDRVSDGGILEWSANEWREVDPTKKSTNPPPFVGELKLLTYNIMSKVNFKHCITALARDHVNPVGAEGIYEFDRMGKIASIIAEANQDFVLLQECDEYEETKLKENKFVRSNYFICSNLFKDCIILSKHKPMWHKLVKLSNEKLGKLAVLTKFQFRTNSFKKVQELLIVNVHLSSDKSNNFLEKRKTQLQILKDLLVDNPTRHDLDADHVVLAGDFNFGDESTKENSTIEHFFIKNGFQDVAPYGSTFDPESNFSAAIASTKTFGRRMDRIYLKSKRKANLELESLDLVGTVPIELKRKSASGEDDFVIFYEPYMKIDKYNSLEIINIHPSHIKRGNLEPLASQPLYLFPSSMMRTKGPDEHFLHPSDHYGIKCSFEFKNSLTDSNLAHQSTLAILVPKGELGTDLIQEIRSKHDPQFKRWPAHMNMFYPFWTNIDPIFGADEDGGVIGDILGTLAAFKPFQCEMNQFQTFGKNSVVYLEPSEESQNSISSIYKALKTLFEDNNHRTWKKELTAHLTIAQPEDKKKAEKNWASAKLDTIKQDYQAKLDELKQQGKNSFCVDCVYWMTRDGNNPFEIRFAFPLGVRYPHTSLGLSEHYFSASNDARDNILKFLFDKGVFQTVQNEKHQFKSYENVIRTLANSLKNPYDTNSAHAELSRAIDLSRINELSLFSDKKLQIIGSFLLGVDVHDLDLGLIVVESGENYGENITEEALVRKLAQSDEIHTIRNITDAVVPIVEITLNSSSKSNSADIQLYKLPSAVVEFFDVNQLSKYYFSNFELMRKIGEKVSDYNKFFALSGVFENQNIKKHVRYYKDFQILLSFVKYWAKSRGIYGKAFGYMSGISLAIMVARYLKDTPTKYLDQLQLDNSHARFERLLVGFFKFYSEWNWNLPISLVDIDHVNESTENLANRTQTRASVTVLQSVFPYHNTTRNITSSSLHIIKSELIRAMQLFKQQNTNWTEDTSVERVYECLEMVCDGPSVQDVIALSSNKIVQFKISIRSAKDVSHVVSLVKGKLYPLLKTIDNTCPNARVYSNLFESNAKDTDGIELILLISLNHSQSGIKTFTDSEKSYIISSCDELKRNALAATHIPFDIRYDANF